MAIYGDMSSTSKRYGKPADLPWLQQQHSERQPSFCRIEFDPQQTANMLHNAAPRTTRCARRAGRSAAAGKRKLLAATARMTLSHPADMRPYLDAKRAGRWAGLYITMLSSSYQVAGDSDFWQLARVVGDIRKQLQRATAICCTPCCAPSKCRRMQPGAVGQQMLASPKGSMISISAASPTSAPICRSTTSRSHCARCRIRRLFTAASSYGGKLILNVNYDAARSWRRTSRTSWHSRFVPSCWRIEHRSGAWPANRAAIGS